MAHDVVDSEHDVRSGCGLLLVDHKAESILMLQRGLQLQHAPGTWGAPGGKQGKLETPLTAVVREFEEETGLRVDPKRVTELGWVSDHFDNNDLHYNTFYFYAPVTAVVSGKLTNMEPDKCEHLDWQHYKEIIDLPLFGCFETLLRKRPSCRDFVIGKLFNLYKTEYPLREYDPTQVPSHDLQFTPVLSP